jgi:hypothetical protein
MSLVIALSAACPARADDHQARALSHFDIAIRYAAASREFVAACEAWPAEAATSSGAPSPSSSVAPPAVAAGIAVGLGVGMTYRPPRQQTFQGHVP